MIKEQMPEPQLNSITTDATTSVSPACTKPNVVCSYLIGDKLKLVKKAYWMQKARKGSIGKVLKSAFSMNKPCYWVEFKNGQEWWMEEHVVLV